MRWKKMLSLALLCVGASCLTGVSDASAKDYDRVKLSDKNYERMFGNKSLPIDKTDPEMSATLKRYVYGDNIFFQRMKHSSNLNIEHQRGEFIPIGETPRGINHCRHTAAMMIEPLNERVEHVEQFIDAQSPALGNHRHHERELHRLKTDDEYPAIHRASFSEGERVATHEKLVDEAILKKRVELQSLENLRAARNKNSLELLALLRIHLGVVSFHENLDHDLGMPLEIETRVGNFFIAEQSTQIYEPPINRKRAILQNFDRSKLQFSHFIDARNSLRPIETKARAIEFDRLESDRLIRQQNHPRGERACRSQRLREHIAELICHARE